MGLISRSATLVATLILTTGAFAAPNPLEKTARDLANDMGRRPESRIAVVGISYPDNRRSEGPSFVSERISTYLASDRRFRLVERDQIEQLLSEHHLSESGLLDSRAAKRVGDILGADIIVTGTLIDIDPVRTELNVRAVFSGTGRIIAAARTMFDRPWAGRHKLGGGHPRKALPSVEPIRALAQALKSELKASTPPLLAVLNFPYNPGRLSTGSYLISERLITSLTEFNMPLIERRLIQSLMKERHLWETGVIDPRSIRSLGRVQGVDAVLVGTLADFPDGERTEIIARIVSLETGEVLAAGTAITDRVWLDNPRLPLMAQARTFVPTPYPSSGLGAHVDVPADSPGTNEQALTPEKSRINLAIDGRNRKKKGPVTRRLPYRRYVIPVVMPAADLQTQGGSSEP